MSECFKCDCTIKNIDIYYCESCYDNLVQDLEKCRWEIETLVDKNIKIEEKLKEIQKLIE